MQANKKLILNFLPRVMGITIFITVLFLNISLFLKKSSGSANLSLTSLNAFADGENTSTDNTDYNDGSVRCNEKVTVTTTTSTTVQTDQGSCTKKTTSTVTDCQGTGTTKCKPSSSESGYTIPSGCM